MIEEAEDKARRRIYDDIPAFEAILQASFSTCRMSNWTVFSAWKRATGTGTPKSTSFPERHRQPLRPSRAPFAGDRGISRIHDPEVYSRLRDRARGRKPITLLDVGTEVVSGIPLAILVPAAAFTLCDSVGKKTRVAGEIARLLGLTNVTVVNARAETLPSRFDYVVSRAVASLTDFYPWVKGKYSKSILYLRGGDLETEITQFRARWRKPESAVRTWPVDAWLKDEYFAGKFVVEIFCKSEQNP